MNTPQRDFFMAAANNKKSLAAAAAKTKFRFVDSRRCLALLPHKEKILAGAAEWIATPIQRSYNQRSID
jgi:hypothetical protein